MNRIWKLALAAPALIVASQAQASINFGTPYLFVSDAEAEKGVSLPLYGGSEREVSYVSVRVYRWVQKDDDPYAFEPAPEVAVYPQMVRLEPLARSTVRLAWAHSASPVDERYYRLVLEEFDRPGTESTSKDSATFGFRVRPRASLPLVVYRKDDVAPAQLSVKVETVAVAATPDKTGGEAADAAGTPAATTERRLRITNTGGTYARVLGVKDVKGMMHNEMVYVLPGSTIDVEIPGLEYDNGREVVYTSGRAEHVRKDGVELRAVPIN